MTTRLPDIEEQIDEIFFDNYNKLHDNMFASEFEAAKSATKAIEAIIASEVAKARIDECKRAANHNNSEYTSDYLELRIKSLQEGSK